MFIRDLLLKQPTKGQTRGHRMSSTQVRRYTSMTALVAGGVVAGGILAGTLTASATDTPSPTTTATQGEAPTNPNPGDPSKPQRSDETLLTGTTASRVTAAVLAKYPSATIVRVETDSDGVYEAHITKGDGTQVAIEVDKSFAVTGVEQGGPGRGRGDHDGDGPAATSSGSST
jgi:hypothetical protein